jgi:hypothetical protein
MNWKFIRWKLLYYAQYFPFTANFFICLGLGWLAFSRLNVATLKGETISPLVPFILVMGKLALLFLAVIVSLSVLSTFACYLWFNYLKMKQPLLLDVQFNIEQKKGTNRLFLYARLRGAVRPFLGFIKGRLWYNDHEFTAGFSLLTNERRKNSFFREAVSGRSRVYLPDIAEYEVKGAFIFFQDMLHLVSLAAPQPVTGHFYQPPIAPEVGNIEVRPRKTESLDTRIDELRRVEGDYLNYKDFEPGDDVRRIVWQVFARNRELVVRTPEPLEPYASHLYFQATFHAFVPDNWLTSGFLAEMLNFYKNNLWSVYRALKTSGWEVRYFPDQEIAIPESIPDEERVPMQLSLCDWQADLTLDRYFKASSAAVMCISSLTHPRELGAMLERCEPSVTIYFVRLSSCFRANLVTGILARIFLQPPGDRLSRLRVRWSLTPLRWSIVQRERQLMDLLKGSDISWNVIE